jgi:hypothetical protein
MRRSDDFRLGVVDPAREFVRREAAEDDGMDRPEARAREHRDDGFRDHRHVDDHSVAASDSLRNQGPCESCDVVAQLAIGEMGLLTS